MGGFEFVKRLEKALHRVLRKQKTAQNDKGDRIIKYCVPRTRKMITETVKDKSGNSDVVWTSGPTLKKMKELYESVTKKDGEKCTSITVVVEAAAG